MIDPRHIEVVINEWIGLYKESWTGVITPEAFAHPAKYSRALIRAIYQHVIEEKWVARGDSVVDPFGGVALGGFDAMQLGLNWTGCELEAKFVGLGNQNIALWNERFSRMPNWGTARLLQGDSRKLAEVLRGAVDTCVSSPPYANGCSHTGGDDPKPEHVKGGEYRGVGITGAISSPPYVSGGHHPDQTGAWGGQAQANTKDQAGYGREDGQLGQMKEGNLNLAISSPPYVAISPEKSSKSVDYTKQYETYRAQGGGASFEKFVATQELHSGGYGDSEGQLSAMKVGDHSIAITSPPYASGEKGHPSLGSVNNDDWGNDGRDITRRRGKTGEYGKTDGQLAEMPPGDVSLAVTSHPFSQPETRDRAPVQDGSVSDFMNRAYTVDRQGQDERNLAGLPQTGFEAAISSPPYEETPIAAYDGSQGEQWRKTGKTPRQRKGGKLQSEQYNHENADNLGNMQRGDFQAAVSSPPYEAQDVNLFCTKNQGKRFDSLTDAEKEERKAATMGNYGYRNQSAMTEGQLSATRGEDFWSASRIILEQLFQVIVPGGHAVFVVKAFVRNKQIVDFPAQWAQLCEAVGFRLLHDHHALLTEHYGTQTTMHGEGDKELSVARKSFFRRLAESKGSPQIDYENVLCFERP